MTPNDTPEEDVMREREAVLLYLLTRARMGVAKLRLYINVLHHPNVAIELAFPDMLRRSAANATRSMTMMQRATIDR